MKHYQNLNCTSNILYLWFQRNSCNNNIRGIFCYPKWNQQVNKNVKHETKPINHFKIGHPCPHLNIKRLYNVAMSLRFHVSITMMNECCCIPSSQWCGIIWCDGDGRRLHHMGATRLCRVIFMELQQNVSSVNDFNKIWNIERNILNESHTSLKKLITNPGFRISEWWEIEIYGSGIAGFGFYNSYGSRIPDLWIL